MRIIFRTCPKYSLDAMIHVAISKGKDLNLKRAANTLFRGNWGEQTLYCTVLLFQVTFKSGEIAGVERTLCCRD